MSMMMIRNPEPDWATHPGEHLSEHIEARGWSQSEFSKISGLSRKLISTIISGTNPVMPETALKLERVLGMRAVVWLNLQSNWDLRQARAKPVASAQAKSWLERFPIADLKSRGVLSKHADVATLQDELLHIFGVGDPASYEARVSSLAVQHRQSKSYRSDPDHVFTWLLLGEAKARLLELPPFDEGKFRAAVGEIRTLTMCDPTVFEPRMKELCRVAGVALVFEKPLGKTRLFGSTRWLSPATAVIQMSLRLKSNDHFWWTFFHEAAHVLLHRGQTFVDDADSDGVGPEAEADAWAEELLIGPGRLEELKRLQPRSTAEVLLIAKERGIHPGIVVGMLQHAGVLPFTHLNKLKVRFDWADKLP